MLVINYNGNKPTTDYFKFSVQGNNNADVVRFCLEKKQGKIDLSGYKVYVQAYCEEDGFIDKVEITDNVNIVDNQLSADWTLLKKHTVNRQLLVSLSFEDLDNEVVWQTQIVKITIANGIDADEEMINKYPSIIEKMQGEIEEVQQEVETLKNKPSKNFVLQKTTKITFKKDVRVLVTLPQRKYSKGIRNNYYGTKKGNYITSTPLVVNTDYSVDTILEAVLGNAIDSHSLSFHSCPINELWLLFNNVDGQPSENGNIVKTFVSYDKSDNPLDYGLIHKPQSSSNIIYFDHDDYDLWARKLFLRPLKKLIFGKTSRYADAQGSYRRIWDKAYNRFMIKFVADYQEHTTAKGKKYWTGTMANVWLNVDVMIRKEDNKIYAYYKVSVKTFK